MISRLLAVLTAAAVVVPSASTLAADPPDFKIYVEHSGVYQVTYEQLSGAGFEGPVSSEGIGLRNLGEPVPVWIDDGGDRGFGPGDRLTFIGEVLRGDFSYLDPFSRFNCYVLSFTDSEPWHGTTVAAAGAPDDEPAQYVSRHHLESDRVMVRFRQSQSRPEESWYWERLSVVDREPYRHELVVDGLSRSAAAKRSLDDHAGVLSRIVREGDEPGDAGDGRLRDRLSAVYGVSRHGAPVRLRFGFRGWSEPRHRERDALPHHEVAMTLNGVRVGGATWDGKDHFVSEIEVSPARIREGVNHLELAVPKRRYPESGDLVIDVVLLNWIEVEYRRRPEVGLEQMRLHPVTPDEQTRISVTSAEGEPVDVYLPTGIRVHGGTGSISYTAAVDRRGFSVLSSSAVAVPDEIVADRPSDLTDGDRQADYIMITHRTLLDSTEALAEFHRGRGLTVAVVDVQDVYDEFNFGVLDPAAIKSFLQHAHDNWGPPAPRFVLLVGDASWDFKNTTADDANYADWTYRPGEARRFLKNKSTPYAEDSDLNHRNLVPTWSFQTLEGHAASDTWFVCLDDGDRYPDMAIGRLPVVSPDELDGVVRKTVEFARSSPVGPWRRNLLFIANESRSFQQRSDLIAEAYSELGYVPTRIYPHPSEPANEHHTRRIVESFDGGLQAVHFVGHGGRYIWRTGPPDLKKNHDLFTLDHLDELAENRKLPVVLSLTCYSAPFDHPTADSIGEKLVRIEDRGAIAVFAASWRNSPSPTMGRVLLDELTTPGSTIGEAILRAKRTFHSDMLIQTYNLLGDPGLAIGVPDHRLKLDVDRRGDPLELRVTMPPGMNVGRLLVEWTDGDGAVLREDRLEVTGSVPRLSVERSELADAGGAVRVRAYAWDDVRRIDGIGCLDFELDTPSSGVAADHRSTTPDADPASMPGSDVMGE
jgi:hypothetical protein